MTLDIDLLRAFVTVADTAHFGRAAERLNRTQSAVSMQIKRLEESIGARLFHRTRRAVRLTIAGEELRVYAGRMLRLNDETLAAFGKAPATGRVRLGATDTSMCFLPPILRRFAAELPLVEMEIRCDRSWEALDTLEAGEVDLALVTQRCGREGGMLVRREPLVWAAAVGSTADRIDPLPLALFGPGCIYRKAVLDALDAIGRPWRHAYNSVSKDGLDVAVAAGLAVTVLPVSALGPHLRRLNPGTGLPDLPQIEILLYRAPGRAPGPSSAATDRLADIITDTLGPVTSPNHQTPPTDPERRPIDPLPSGPR